MSEENTALEEDLDPEPAMTPEEREVAIEKRMAEAKLARVKRGSPKKRSAPIKKHPPNYPQDSYNIETPGRKMNQPWKPAAILTARKKDGMRSRWCSLNLLEKRLEEGWQPRLRSSGADIRVDAPVARLIDGKPLSSYTIKGNLILCDMPEEMAKSRDEYFKRINDAGLKSQKSEFTQSTTVGGASYSYGDVKIEK